MKKTLKSLFLLALVCMIAFSAIACTPQSETTGSQPEAPSSSTNKSEQPPVPTTQAPPPFNVADYPEKFEDWTMDDFMKYLKETKVIEHEDWIMEVPEKMYAEYGISDNIYYLETTKGDVIVQLYYFAPGLENSQRGDVASKGMLTCGAGTTPIDTVFGNFAVYYTSGMSKDFKTTMKNALEQLCQYFNVTPEF